MIFLAYYKINDKEKGSIDTNSLIKLTKIGLRNTYTILEFDEVLDTGNNNCKTVIN